MPDGYTVCEMNGHPPMLVPVGQPCPEPPPVVDITVQPTPTTECWQAVPPRLDCATDPNRTTTTSTYYWVPPPPPVVVSTGPVPITGPIPIPSTAVAPVPPSPPTTAVAETTTSIPMGLYLPPTGADPAVMVGAALLLMATGALARWRARCAD